MRGDANKPRNVIQSHSGASTNKDKEAAHDIDKKVGGRLRIAREMRRLSQKELAQAVGLVFQQIQKYETGIVRISAGRLFLFATVLKVPVNFFYQDVISDYVNGVGVEPVIVDLSELSSAKSEAIRSIIDARTTDAETIRSLLKRLSESPI